MLKQIKLNRIINNKFSNLEVDQWYSEDYYTATDGRITSVIYIINYDKQEVEVIVDKMENYLGTIYSKKIHEMFIRYVDMKGYKFIIHLCGLNIDIDEYERINKGY